MGRRSDNDIVVDETTVSRRHSLIMETPDGYVVRDLNTTNGTFVNQNWLDQSERILHRGDQIRLGGSEVTIMFRQEGPRTMTMTTGTPPPSKQPAAPIPDLSMSTPVQPPAPAVILEPWTPRFYRLRDRKKGPSLATPADGRKTTAGPTSFDRATFLLSSKAPTTFAICRSTFALSDGVKRTRAIFSA